MKKLTTLVFFILLLYTFSYGQTEKVKIAVLDFPAVKGVINKQEAIELTKKFADELSKFAEFEILSGEDLNSKMKELKLSSKKLNPAKFKNIGEKLDVNYILQSEILQAVNVSYTHNPYLGTEDLVYDISNLNTAKIEKYTDEYNVKTFIIDVKDGSSQYSVIERNKGKSFQKIISKLSEKVYVKITTKPIEVIKISETLYLYPEEMGPMEIVEGYRVCNEIDQRKMYGYGDWRPPTTEEMIEIIRYLNSIGIKQAPTYILDESNMIFDAIQKTEKKMKIGFGFNHENYSVYRNNPDYKVMWGEHYLRLVRGGIPEN